MLKLPRTPSFKNDCLRLTVWLRGVSGGDICGIIHRFELYNRDVKVVVFTFFVFIFVFGHLKKISQGLIHEINLIILFTRLSCSFCIFLCYLTLRDIILTSWWNKTIYIKKRSNSLVLFHFIIFFITQNLRNSKRRIRRWYFILTTKDWHLNDLKTKLRYLQSTPSYSSCCMSAAKPV